MDKAELHFVRLHPVAGQRLHVRSRSWPDRMICGRKDTGLSTVELADAARQGNLCAKCAQQVAGEMALAAMANAPRPAGYQYDFGFDCEGAAA